MDNILKGGNFFMKNPLFKDNVEDREIRFKTPEEIDVIHNKSNCDINQKGGNNGR